MFQLTMKTLSVMMVAATAVTATPSSLRTGSDATAEDAMAQLLSRLDTLEKQNHQLKKRMNALEEDSHQRHLNTACGFTADKAGTCVMDQPAAFTSGLVVDGLDTDVFIVDIPTTLSSDVTIKGPDTAFPTVVTAPAGAVDAEGEPLTSYTVQATQPVTSFKMSGHINVDINTDDAFTIYNPTNFQGDVMVEVPTSTMGLKLTSLVVEESKSKKSKRTHDRNLKHKSQAATVDANAIQQPNLYVGGEIKVGEMVEVLNGKLVLHDGDLEVLDGDASIAGELEAISVVVKDDIETIEGGLTVGGGAVFDGDVEADAFVTP